MASHQKLTMTNWEQDPLTTTWEVAEELDVDHSTVVWHLKQTEKVKNLDKWVTLELTENKKYHHFEVSSSLNLCNSEPFLNQSVTCNEKWILYDTWWSPAQCLDQEEAPNHFPKPNLHQKNVMVTVWWADPSQLSESWWKHCIWDVCSTDGWDALKSAVPTASVGQQKRPNSAPWQCLTTWQPRLQKLNKLGYEVLSHPLYSPDLSPTDCHFFKQLFAGKMLPQPAGGRKCFPRVPPIPEAQIFPLQE